MVAAIVETGALSTDRNSAQLSLPKQNALDVSQGEQVHNRRAALDYDWLSDH